MTTITVLNEKPISMADVKEELAKIQKKRGELNYRANKTSAYLQDYVRMPHSKTAELIATIEKLKIPRIKEEHIIKIVDTLPKYAEEVKALLTGYTITLSQESAKKIADAVKEAVDKK